MNNWAKFYETITKPLPIASSLFLLAATSFLLFGGASALDKLGLSDTIAEYRWVVALLFIIAATWLVVTSLIWVGKKCLQAWTIHQAEKKQQKRLHALTVDERRILLRYVENDTRTQIFFDAPDLGAAQGLADDGVLYRPDVAPNGVAVTYNIQEWALAYLNRNKGLVAPVVSTETRWSGTLMSSKSPDWFARSFALVAIVLTVIGLYFTHRTYKFQTKTYQEGLEERILVRLGFQRDVDTNGGVVGVEIVNIGTRPIYLKFVEVDVPNGCEIMNVKRDRDVLPDACGLTVYDRNPTRPNDEPMKPSEPGEEKDYKTKWDFAKFPIEQWVENDSSREHLWVRVQTTKKGFRQHPIFSWAEITQTISQKYRSSGTRNKNHQ